MAEALAVKLTLAVVCVMALVARAVGALQAGAPTVKLAVLTTVLQRVETVMGPVVAPAGTVAVSWLGAPSTKEAATPLKRTPVTSEKPAPLMVTVLPTGAVPGEKPLMAARARTVTATTLEVPDSAPAVAVAL